MSSIEDEVALARSVLQARLEAAGQIPVTELEHANFIKRMRLLHYEAFMLHGRWCGSYSLYVTKTPELERRLRKRAAARRSAKRTRLGAGRTLRYLD